MNRREWIKNASIASGAIILPDFGIKNIFSEANNTAVNELEEIHLLNMSHTDFGYTDLPSSIWKDQVNTLRLAINYITETKNYPSDARFKWTAESLWVVEKFLEEASAEEKKLFDQYVSQGSIEVTAMPCNFSPLCGRYELEREMDRLWEIARKYKISVAYQNDVNGLSYGLIDMLYDRGVKHIVMGANGYMGGNPVATPSFFWWKSLSGKQLLLYNGEHYMSAYTYFNEGEWRHGPVPNRHDVWFNPPTGNEIFNATPQGLQKAVGILKHRLEQLKNDGYNYKYIQVPFTNHWTGDNDIPCRQLSEFIRAWNDAGLKPKLVFSTPSIFFGLMKEQLSTSTPVLQGEWSDWWATGIASTPYEVSVYQSAKRRNMDIGNSLQWMIKPAGFDKKKADLNKDLVLAAEHTWGSYDCVVRPYGERTKGAHYQKMDILMRNGENSKLLKADVIRAGKNFKPFSQTNKFEIFNPGETDRSGWVELSARAFRIQANCAKELATGKIYPFLQTLASEWTAPDSRFATPPDFPNDVWPYLPEKYRFHIENLKPGETRKFELLYDANISTQPLSGSRYFDVKTDSNGCVANIRYIPANSDLFVGNEYAPAQVIVERPQGKGVRDVLASHQMNPAHILHSSPSLVDAKHSATPYSLVYQRIMEEPFAKRIEQQWHVFDLIPRIEIITTIWTKEVIDPMAVYIALPFNVADPDIFYDSLGVRVQAGVNQIPGTCGEYQTLQSGASMKGRNFSLAISTLDYPMCVFDSLQRGSGRKIFKPETANFFNLICDNYWTTNFPVLNPSKLIIKQVIDLGNAGELIEPLKGDEIWAYPC